MTSIADLRKSYERAELSEDASHADPLQQFSQWLDEAIKAGVPEPNAMTLATVGSNLRPSTRVVLIKGLDVRGIVWYTNYGSRKGQELAGNPYAALQFHWVELERVVRIEGVVERVEPAQSDAYFKSRPLDSRIGAWASPQSQVISSRAVLVANAARYGAQFLLQPPRPPHWGGYRLKPDNWQFWHQPIATPMRRARRVQGIAGRGGCGGGHQFGTRRDHAALRRGPGTQARIERTRRVVGVRLGAINLRHKPFDAHHALQLDPMELQCGIGLVRQLQALAALVIGVPDDAACIETLDQHDACRRPTVGADSRQRHCIRLRHFGL